MYKRQAQLALDLSVYFNRISNEFTPLTQADIPKTFDRGLPVLRPYQVSQRIKNIEKPRSKIEGDIFPSLMSEFFFHFIMKSPRLLFGRRFGRSK